MSIIQVGIEETKNYEYHQTERIPERELLVILAELLPISSWQQRIPFQFAYVVDIVYLSFLLAIIDELVHFSSIQTVSWHHT